MAGSLIYDSAFAQFLPPRPSPPPPSSNSVRRHEHMLYQDAQNTFLAGPLNRRPSPPAILYQGLPPHHNDVVIGMHHHRSRSERSRKAMSVPVRHPSSIPPTPQNHFRSPHPGDIGPASLQHSFPWAHDEVIAEFSPRDQLALNHVLASVPNQNRPPSRPPSAQNPVPPRLKVNPRQSRSRNWRSNDAESLPPRFRSPQPNPGPRVPSPPFNPPWNRPPHANLSRVDVSGKNVPALSHFPPQLSQPQHLSSFLQSNVSYRPQQVSDTRREQESKRIEISPKAKTLAPIGAERAQLLAANPRFCAVNNCTPHNCRHSLPANSYSYDPLLQSLRPCQLTRTSKLPTGPSELEISYNRLKRTPNVSRILSPLNPIRNPESSVVPSDAKWMKEEVEIRRRRIMTSLDTSAFARRAGDRRSRTECEEFMPGLDISDHCYGCRQDSLCKRLLVQRAREMLRSTSTSPISSEGTLSSDEEDEILNAHVDAIDTLGKGFKLKTSVTVADMESIVGNEDVITLPSTVELMA